MGGGNRRPRPPGIDATDDVIFALYGLGNTVAASGAANAPP